MPRAAQLKRVRGIGLLPERAALLALGVLIKPGFSLLFRGLSGLMAKSPLLNIPTGFLTLAARGWGMIIGYAGVSCGKDPSSLAQHPESR